MTPRSLIAVVAAVAAAFAIGAPAASADVPEYPVSFGETGGNLTFRYHDPAQSAPNAAVLIDTNDDGKADMSIVAYWTVNNTLYANFSSTSHSTFECQEVTQGGGTNVPTAQPAGDVELIVPRQYLPRTFTAKVVKYFTAPWCPLTDSSGVYASMAGAERFGIPGPANVTALPGDGQVELAWEPVAGANAYNVYADGELIRTLSDTHTTVTVANDQMHRFEVASVKAGVEYARTSSESIQPTAPLSAPAHFTADAGDGQVTLTWDAVPGAESFKVYANDTFVRQTDSDTLTATITASNDHQTRFSVAAIKRLVEYPRSELLATPTAALSAPQNFTAAPGDHQVTLSWDALAGAESYNLYVDGQPARTVTGDRSSATVENLDNEQPYRFQLAAVKRGKEYPRTVAVNTAPTPPLSAPAHFSADAGDGQVTLTWDPVQGADAYHVHTGHTVRTVSASTNHLTVTAENDRTVTYAVAAVKRGFEYPRSASEQATPNAPLSAPAILSADAGDGQVTLVWTPVERADGYNVYANGVLVESLDAYRSATIVIAASGTSFEVAAVKRGKEYPRSASMSATPHAPIVVDPPVDPQPPVTPQPPVGPQPTDPKPPVNPSDPDADGIRNDWKVNGKPAPAPAKPQVKQIAGTSIKLTLPKAAKGTTLAVYVRAPGGTFAKFTSKADKRGVLTMPRLKRSTFYEIKLVKVKTGKQSAASMITVKTRK